MKSGLQADTECASRELGTLEIITAKSLWTFRQCLQHSRGKQTSPSAWHDATHARQMWPANKRIKMAEITTQAPVRLRIIIK